MCQFGGPNNEGKRFVLSEVNYLWSRNKALIPLAILRTAAKLTGYKLGRREAMLSRTFKRRVSMHQRFWGD
jgi:rhamnosyltransferase